jgi:hypothetical protein
MRFVFSAIPIYLLIVINVPKWFLILVHKIRRGFIWKGSENVNGGCCLVTWDKVQQPLNLGGLGIHNLETVGLALQVRWQWFKKNYSRWSPGGLRTSLSCKHTSSILLCNNNAGWQRDEHFVLVGSMASWMFYW